MHCMCIQKEIEKIGTFGINLLFHFMYTVKTDFKIVIGIKGGKG